MSDIAPHHRRSIRLAGYEYSQAGAYFVTICTHQKRPVFGRVVDDGMQRNVYGEMVRDCWLAISDHFPHVVVDEWIVMPNHMHGIVVITDDTQPKSPVGAGFPRPPHESHPESNSAQSRAGKPRPYEATLGQIVGYFKYQSTKRINQYRAERDLPPVRVWQRNYYERIIRDETELNDTRRYIIENPANWATDENHP
ncbi:MAG TPA: transposase [Abditibacteriaceae bacterium]